MGGFLMKKAIRGIALVVVLAVGLATISGELAVAQEKKVKDKGKGTATAGARFEIYKDKGGKFRYRFYAADGEEVGMAVRGYTNKADVMKLVDAIRRDAAKAKIEDTAK
jgi:uncharacterized protein YegP (UPF0339 family)